MSKVVLDEEIFVYEMQAGEITALSYKNEIYYRKIEPETETPERKMFKTALELLKEQKPITDTPIEFTKVCSVCKQDLPKTEFYKDKYKSDGLSYRCRECDRKYQRERSKLRKKKRELEKNRSKIIKTCLRCGENKTGDDFHLHKKSKDGLQPYCKKCMIEYNIKRRKERDRKGGSPSKKKVHTNGDKRFRDNSIPLVSSGKKDRKAWWSV